MARQRRFSLSGGPAEWIPVDALRHCATRVRVLAQRDDEGTKAPFAAIVAACAGVAACVCCTPEVQIFDELVSGFSTGATAGSSAGGSGAAAGAPVQGGAAGAGGGTGGAALPTEGASTPCQLLASVGVWYHEPEGEACTACIRDLSGQDAVSFTPCSTLGAACFVDPGCNGIWVCIDNASYALDSFEACFAEADASDQASFLSIADCLVVWCGAPDKCAFSGDTPSCSLEPTGP